MQAVDIANLALDVLKEAPLASLNDQRPLAAWFRRNVDQRRRALLSKWEWNFAIRRAALVEGPVPAFGWSHSYAVPSDALRILPLTWDGYPKGAPVEHEIEGGVILTNRAGPLRLRYIFDQTDYDRWSPACVDALAMDLCMKCSHWLTGKSGFYQIAADLYQRAVSDAWNVDAVEGTATEAADSAWTDIR